MGRWAWKGGVVGVWFGVERGAGAGMRYPGAWGLVALVPRPPVREPDGGIPRPPRQPSLRGVGGGAAGWSARDSLSSPESPEESAESEGRSSTGEALLRPPLEAAFAMEGEGWEVRWVGAPQEIEGVWEWPLGVVGRCYCGEGGLSPFWGPVAQAPYVGGRLPTAAQPV